MSWAARLRARRQHLGWTQRRVGLLASVDQSSIAQYESGKATPSDDVKIRLAAALGCELGELFPWPAGVPPLRDAATRRTSDRRVLAGAAA